MPSDVFWTGLFTFGGGLVGASVSYAATHRQGRLQEQQLGLDETKHQGEVLAQGQERNDQLRQGRRELYLRYLKAVDEIVHLPTGDSTTPQILAERWSAFMQADNALELGGSEKIQKSSYPLFALLGEIIYRYSEILESDSSIWPDDASSFMRSVEEKFRSARQEAISLMRADLETH